MNPAPIAHFSADVIQHSAKSSKAETKIARIGVWALSTCKNSVALSFERTMSKAGHFLPSKRHFFFCSDY
jgi:hypothetical protein